MKKRFVKSAAASLLSVAVLASGSLAATAQAAPQDTLTRAQFLKQVVDTVGLKPQDEPGSAFRDTANHWVEKQGYIDVALKNGIITKGTHFRPNQPITRAQAAAMMVRAVDTKFDLAPIDAPAPYADTQRLDTFSDELTWNAWLGLMNSYPNSRLLPYSPLSSSLAQLYLGNLKSVMNRDELPPPQIMKLSAIQPGMKGVAQTVISGHQRETIDIEVIEVLRGQGYGGTDVILVRASGPVLKKATGLAQGMSGSPVYINGRIIGAIALAFEDETIAGVTPIESMLQGAPLTPKVGTVNLKNKVSVMGKAVERLEIAASDQPVTHKQGTLVLRQLPVPIMVSGFSNKVLENLQKEMDKHGVKMVNVAGSSQDTAKSLGRALQPGDSMGLALAHGDLQAYGIGTVTYVHGDRLWGFGHPMDWAGEVDYPLTEAWITMVMKGLPGLFPPYKIGYIGKTVGSITQDRAASVAGRLGQQASVVPVHITSRDGDTGNQLTLNVEMARSENYFSYLTSAAAAEGVIRAMDRIGAGTISYTLTVETEGRNPITRTDMSYDPYDLSYAPYMSLMNILDMLQQNPYQEVNIQKVIVTATTEKQNRTAQLVRAELVDPEATIQPGDTVRIRVTLKPFRQPEQTIIVPVKLPEWLTGPVELYLRGGSEGAGYFGFNQKDSLDEMIEEWVNAPRGNDIVVEFGGMWMGGMDVPVFGGDMDGEQITHGTDWVVQGYLEYPVFIMVGEMEEEEAD